MLLHKRTHKFWVHGSSDKLPESLTPVEMGKIIDDKLDNRDLISFVFLWATQGFITLKENLIDPQKSDFILTQLKELPEHRSSFERSFFEGIFPHKKDAPVLLSSLINTKMNKGITVAKEQLTQYLFASGIYEEKKSNTNWLRKLMYVIVILGVISGLYLGRADIFISFGLSGIIILLFVLSTPNEQKTQKGWEVYRDVKRFKNYLTHINKNDLKQLITHDPEYFYKMLPYSIALDIGPQWVRKFKGLMDKFPGWYIISQHSRVDSRNLNIDFYASFTFCLACFDCVINNASLSPTYINSRWGTWGGSRGGSGGGGGGW